MPAIVMLLVKRRRKLKTNGKHRHYPMVKVITQIVATQDFLAPVNLWNSEQLSETAPSVQSSLPMSA
jgi:hypothetical protein